MYRKLVKASNRANFQTDLCDIKHFRCQESKASNTLVCRCYWPPWPQPSLSISAVTVTAQSFSSEAFRHTWPETSASFERQKPLVEWRTPVLSEHWEILCKQPVTLEHNHIKQLYDCVGEMVGFTTNFSSLFFKADFLKQSLVLLLNGVLLSKVNLLINHFFKNLFLPSEDSQGHNYLN